ncbi:MAG: leucine-rich repeat domain-containing protein [Prochloraceae cyanobacterium]
MLLITKPSRYLLLLISLFFLSGETIVNANKFDRPESILTSKSDREDLTITFADPILEDAIREKLDLTYPEPLTREQLSKITSLGISSKSISKLDGIEYLTNLKLLWLDSNQISDLSPLTRLTNLNYLGLSDNQISDISPLSKLNNLSKLNFKNNSIINFAPIRNLAEKCIGCEISSQKF